MKATATEKGFKFVETLCKRGDPAKIVCTVAIEDKIDLIIAELMFEVNNQKIF